MTTDGYCPGPCSLGSGSELASTRNMNKSRKAEIIIVITLGVIIIIAPTAHTPDCAVLCAIVETRNSLQQVFE